MKKEEGIYLENFNTLDDFQKFVDDNNIINTSDLKKRFGSKIYKKLLNLGFGGKISFHGKLNRIKFSKEEIQEYINSNGIASPKEFLEKHSFMYRKANKMKILDKLEYRLIRKISYYGRDNTIYSLDDIQKFLTENNIESPKEFYNINRGLYDKSRKSGYLNKLKYNKIIKGSLLEKEIRELLNSFKDLEFSEQKTFDWLFYKKKLKIDFVSEKYKFIIEVQGEQHFRPINYFGGETTFAETKQRDMIKYSLCKNHGYVVLYYTNINTFSEFGINEINNYFEKVYISIEELSNSIQNMILEHKNYRL